MIAASLIVGVAYLFAYVSESDFKGEPVFSAFIKPPMFAVAKPTSIETFFEDTSKLSAFDIDRTDK